MGKAPGKIERRCFVLRPIKNTASDLNEDQRAAIDLQYYVGELRSCCAMLWDLDTLLLEYLRPDPRRPSRQLGSLAYTSIDLRHLILQQLKDIIAEMEGHGD
jgi:hypothetical protein